MLTTHAYPLLPLQATHAHPLLPYTGDHLLPYTGDHGEAAVSGRLYDGVAQGALNVLLGPRILQDESRGLTLTLTLSLTILVLLTLTLTLTART